MTYSIMTDGILYSKHESRAEAEAKFKEAVADAQKEVNLRELELESANEFLLSLTLKEGADDGLAN
jgi:predicted transcriptional regulator